MKNNQARTKKENNAARRSTQRRQYRELLISQGTRDRLDSIAITVCRDPLRIAKRAIESYLGFVEKHYVMAQAQPRFRECQALLVHRSPEWDKTIEKLDGICRLLGLEPNQVCDSAIDAYASYAESVCHQGHKSFIAKYPGEFDESNIEFVIEKDSDQARSAFKTSLSEIAARPFPESVGLLRGLLKMMMYHPGLGRERAGLEMIVEGAQRIGALCYENSWGAWLKS